MKKPILTLRGAARSVGVSYETIRNWCRRHKIGERVNGIWMIDEAKLRRHMEMRKRPNG